MTGEAPDLRSLLGVAPADYVTERTRLAKQARSNGEKALAVFVQGLKRPTIAMWAVLAAGADAKAVHRAIEATIALGDVQAAGGDISAMAEAVGRRRAAVGILVESGIAELARWEIVGGPRRQEIREIVDQLVLRADLAASWIDGTLRDLPEQSGGFDAFANLALVPRPTGLALVAAQPEAPTNASEPGPLSQPPTDELAARRAKARQRSHGVTAEERAERELAERLRAEREQAEHARAERERAERLILRENAQRLVEAAATGVRSAEERRAAAQDVLRDAQTSAQAADAAHAAAVQRHIDALAMLDELIAQESP